MRLHTDEGLIGHGETKYAPDALRGFIRTFSQDLATTNISIENGFALPPEGPGLGTALLPDVLTRLDATVVVWAVA